SAVQTLLRCCERADLQVRSLTLAVLAAAEAALTPEEKELGVALLDVGGGTTGMVTFHRGAVQHTALLPIGGSHITNDLAAGLRTPLAETEKNETASWLRARGSPHSGRDDRDATGRRA